MFATLGRSQGTLQTVEQSDRLPSASHGNGHDACLECRQRKLKCSGEKTGCSRCLAQAKTCTYANSRASRKDGQRKRPTSDSSDRTALPVDKAQQPPLDAPASTVVAPTFPSTAPPGMDPSLDTADCALSEHDWPNQLGLEDFPSFDTPLSAFESLSDDSRNTASPLTTPLSMDVDFDTFFALPESPKAFPSSSSFSSSSSISDPTQRNGIAPKAPMLHTQGKVTKRPTNPQRQRNITKPFPSDISSSSPQPSPVACRPNKQAVRLHTCILTATHLLESVHASPKDRAQPNELFRFLRSLKRHISILASLTVCAQCSQTSMFLTLLSASVMKLVAGLAETAGILASRNIDISSSGFDDYGVDTDHEFVDLYSNMILPHLDALRAVVVDLGQKAMTEMWKVPYDNFRLAHDQLGVLELEMQAMQPAPPEA